MYASFHETNLPVRAALEASRDAFYILVAVKEGERIVDFTFEMVNQGAGNYLRVSPEESIGKRLLEIYPGERTEEIMDEYIRVLQSGEPLARRLESSLTEDRVLDLYAVKVDDDRVALTLRDVTQDLEREHRLERALAAEREARTGLEWGLRQLHEAQIQLELRHTELQAVNERLRALASTDGLTGLWNHRAFYERLMAETSVASRHGQPFTVLMMDLDHFKKYNDTYGHRAGDDLLAEFARVVRRTLRAEDYAARYGGEEFAVILPLTLAASAKELAERLRAEVGAIATAGTRISVSIGIATIQPGESAEDVLKRADDALYSAKRTGRNRVVIATGKPPENGGAPTDVPASP